MLSYILRALTRSSVVFLSGATVVSAQQSSLCAIQNGQLTPEWQRTVVITNAGEDAQVFANDSFSLARTLKTILATAVPIDKNAGAPSPETQKELASSESEQITLLTSLIRSFRVLNRSNQNVVNNATVRLNEAALQARDILANMKPVGLFNRRDLAPASYRYCGEHRVVYAMGTGANRMFLIFEAAVDNPDPVNKPAGCLRVAKFWDSLKTMPAADRPEALRAFYFDGDLKDGGPLINAVLDNKHLGVPFGQVRGNLFLTKGDIAGNPWMLREWRTFPSVASNTTFIPDTVKTNPNPEFYTEDPLPGGKNGRTQDFADLRPEFLEQLLVSHVREMIEIDLNAARENRKPTGDELFNGLSGLFDDRFNDFESVSQNSSDDPLNIAQQKLKDAIDAELKKYALPSDWKLDNKHILARASALSCAGCHNLAVGNPIAPGGDEMKWPDAALPSDTDPGSFVHITEKAKLSPALLNHFLPARCQNLQKFIKDNSTPATASSEKPAIEGSRARRALNTFTSLEGVDEKSEALPALRDEIQDARRDDAATPGAFRRFRRTH